jgi:methyl coenzyme M reductase subunit D
MSESRSRTLPAGTWGGQHISIEVTAQKTTIEYDCAHATIDQSITLDRYGRFNVSGRQFPEHGGPVREEDEAGHPARFSGQVKGNSMTLKVENSATRELIGNFTVVHGAEPRLFKCK